MSEHLTTCPNPVHIAPPEVRDGSDEAWRQWANEPKPPCPDCEER